MYANIPMALVHGSGKAITKAINVLRKPIGDNKTNCLSALGKYISKKTSSRCPT